MRVVVTGASGFIGRNVLLRAPRSWEIVALYHRAVDFPAFVAARGLGHVRTVACDLTGVEDVERLGAAIGGDADATLYLAANGDPSRSVPEPLWDLQCNTVAVVNFLARVRTRHVVFVSSGAVYDGLEGPVSPASLVRPALPYAISKLASEGYVRFHAERRGWPASYANVRFFGAYGPGEPARKITTRFLRAVESGQREFTLRGDGRNLIDFMYVDDAVDGFLRLLTDADDRRTLDFAFGSPINLDELVQGMGRALGVPVDVRHEGETAEYIRIHSVDPTMRERFGVVPRTPLEVGLRRLQASLGSEGHAAARVAQPA